MTRPFLFKKTNRRDTLAALLVTLLPLLYFFPAVRGRLILAPDDGVLFNVPLRVAVANMMRSGYLPLWNPYIFGGVPLHGAAQAGILFPLNWFYLFFNPPFATNLVMISTYALAALGAYLYARRIGASITGAVATSLIWQWSGFLVGQLSHMNIVQTAALLPWLLWAVDAYGVTGDRRYGLALAIIVALQAFTGHPQTLVYSLLLAAAYAIVMWRASRVARNWYLWSLLLLAAGVLLAAVQILPTYELMRNSLRANSSFDFFSSFSLPPRFLLTFFAPYLMGGGDNSLFRAPYVGEPFYGEFIGYVGLGTLMLAALGILIKREVTTKFWIVVTAVALALALGRYLPLKLYSVIYYVPVLNLFRVSARHMMELDLALAVLAGRGLTVITATRDTEKLKKWALMVGAGIFLLACLSVTIGRPAAFRLGREAPVSLMRAPELFLPLVFGALSTLALWSLARRRNQGAVIFMLTVLALDLVLWGQSSGWRASSPRSESEYWKVPETVSYLHGLVQDQMPYRILTVPHPFDPAVPPVGPSVSRSTEWVIWTQPDVYMMHGIENAAGYDGFGFARYSQLAGEMKVWGELSNPDRTLRGDSREVDILNVRYLLSIPSTSSSSASSTLPKSQLSTRTTSAPFTFPAATTSFGEHSFAEEDFKLPSLSADSSISFEVPPVEVDTIALLTNLSWSLDLPDGTSVARISLHTNDGHELDFDLRVGDHTSEWAYDRPDLRRQMKNKRATVATSYTVAESQPKYQGHTYVSSFKFPNPTTITGGEIKVLKLVNAPDLRLSIFRISFANEKTSFPVRPEWIIKHAASEPTQVQQRGRWRHVAELTSVSVFENTQLLPRAWLASRAQVLNEKTILEVIRSGSLPDGNLWDPRVTALVETPLAFSDSQPDPRSQIQFLNREPNQAEIRTSSPTPAILVLSENYFPGWTAKVDGRAVHLLRVNYNLRGVVLPAGEHRVEFVYRPGSVLIGLVVSLFALAALMLWMARFFPEEPARRFISKLFSR